MAGRARLTQQWAVHSAPDRQVGPPSRRLVATAALVLVVLGVLAAAARLDLPSDPGVVRLERSAWHADGVTVSVPAGVGGALKSDDVVTAIAGHPLAAAPGGLARPHAGERLDYVVNGVQRQLSMARPSVPGLLADGWGDLVFVLALAVLAVLLAVRRPEAHATSALLIAAAGLLGSTLAVVAGLPPLALALGGPVLVLYELAVVVVYAIGWGGVLATSLTIVDGHPWLRRAPRAVLAGAYTGPVLLLTAWTAVAMVSGTPLPLRLGLLGAGTTVVVAVTGIAGVVAAVVAYRFADEHRTRVRLRWLGGGGAVTIAAALAGWQLPELILGHQLLPSGSLGLSGLPFVVGLGVALWRHRLFDIERLVNRSLVAAAVLAVLVAGYAGVVALLAAVLGLSGTIAAAMAAAVIAFALAPVRTAVSSAVNRLMYGDRDDPARVLGELGARMQAVPLPDDVLPAAVAAIAHSLRVPFVAVGLRGADGAFHTAAELGSPSGGVHTEALTHAGAFLGRLQVSDRGPEDPLDATDRAVLAVLAAQIGPAVQAVRLHEDLLASRAGLVASREDERRRLRRDLHDGLGPSLAAIRLKTGLAARGTVPGSATRALLDEIGTEVEGSIADIRRVVDALRPPALDELGLTAALAAKAAALSGELAIVVEGPSAVAGLAAAGEIAAYHIAIEAMTNAVRHSRGSWCAVRIVLAAGELELTVEDDGVGPGAGRDGGVGLRSMTERAAEIGGRCSISARPAGGTSVVAAVPIEAAS